MAAERLHKILARAGVASRRDCETMIADGRVIVNGKVVSQMGVRIDPAQDTVLVDGQPLPGPAERVYILLHKPIGVVSTAQDPQGRTTVIDLVETPTRIFPVGRLDANSEGLLLLTNDGELTHYLTHPGFEVEKEYHALLDYPLRPEDLQTWREGVMLHKKRTAPAQVDVLEQTVEGAWVRIVLHEGRKRQIREVAQHLGYTVLRLVRVREGALFLDNLPPGGSRTLTTEEIHELRDHLMAQRQVIEVEEHHQNGNGNGHSNGNGNGHSNGNGNGNGHKQERNGQRDQSSSQRTTAQSRRSHQDAQQLPADPNSHSSSRQRSPTLQDPRDHDSSKMRQGKSYAHYRRYRAEKSRAELDNQRENGERPVPNRQWHEREQAKEQHRQDRYTGRANRTQQKRSTNRNERGRAERYDRSGGNWNTRTRLSSDGPRIFKRNAETDNDD